MKSFAANIAALSLLGLPLNTQAAYIYSNTNPMSDLGERLGATEGIWFGDEVSLAGVARSLVGFSVQFWSQNTTALNLDVALLINDGPLSAGYPSPYTSIYSLNNIYLPNNMPRATLVFDSIDLGGGIDITGVNNLTLALRFNNIGAGSAGVDLYNPVDIGTSSNDYWLQVGGNWQLTTNSNPLVPVNFAMRIEAIPEPSASALVLFGGLATLVCHRTRRRA